MNKPPRSLLWPPTLALLAMMSPAAGALPVEIRGVPDAVARNVREHLGLHHLPCETSALRLGQRLDNADQQISAGLRSLGYYNARWQLKRQRGDDNCWTIQVDVEPGEPVRIREVAVRIEGEGDDDPQLTKLLGQLPLTEGERLDHGDYEAARNRLLQRARLLGYFEASLSKHRLRVNPEAGSARIAITLASGPRYRFGTVRYADTPLSTSFLRRYQPFASGDRFDARELITFQNRLLNTRYFDRVAVEQAEPDPEQRTVDVTVELAVRSRYQSTLGAGVSTDTGPRVNYSLRNRHFNENGDNFLFSSQWSPVESRVTWQVVQPGREPHREKTRWSLGWQREETDSAISRGWRAEAARIQVRDNGWVRTPSLTFLSENYRVGGESDRTMLLYPGIHWNRTDSNDTRYPTRGWRLGFGARGAVEDLISETSFFQVEAGTKLILPLLGGRLLTRGRAAATWVEEFSKLPASLRFFAGGDNSVRGFDYEALGPTNDEGEVEGGKYLLSGSVEYDYPVFERYSAAVFYDIGNAFNTDQFRLYDSAGVGLRWRSPIGPIRLDLAVPLGESGFRIHLSMGPDL